MGSSRLAGRKGLAQGFENPPSLENATMQAEPELTGEEIDWLLRAHLRADVVVPTEIEDLLIGLGLMERKRSWATISDAGRNWLARNGHLRRSALG